tara:strand:- start:583 stop:867 length:285 start_codon:yes stop_codon:yes gene_type:complete
MKKIILLLIGLTVISCGGDDDDTSGCLVCDKAVILTTDGANQERTEYTWEDYLELSTPNGLCVGETLFGQPIYKESLDEYKRLFEEEGSTCSFR